MTRENMEKSECEKWTGKSSDTHSLSWLELAAAAAAAADSCAEPCVCEIAAHYLSATQITYIRWAVREELLFFLCVPHSSALSWRCVWIHTQKIPQACIRFFCGFLTIESDAGRRHQWCRRRFRCRSFARRLGAMLSLLAIYFARPKSNFHICILRICFFLVRFAYGNGRWNDYDNGRTLCECSQAYVVAMPSMTAMPSELCECGGGIYFVGVDFELFMKSQRYFKTTR